MASVLFNCLFVVAWDFQPLSCYQQFKLKRLCSMAYWTFFECAGLRLSATNLLSAIKAEQATDCGFIKYFDSFG